MPQLAYILSLPRSGSTVLSALLDKRQGVVSPPESSFPQVLGVISPQDRADPLWMAALYMEATFVPTPLSLEEAAACMNGTSDDILIALGRAIAGKLGRDPSAIQAVVWKTPRTVGIHAGPLSTSGRFIILRRNPHNVFESQFRVGFGENNRNPYRFALFRESYEHAFSKIPAERCININYDDLPGAVSRILTFLSMQDCGPWLNGISSLELAAQTCYWMNEVTSEFRNRDPEKRARLSPRQVRSLERAMLVCRGFRPFMGPLRHHYDWVSMKRIFQLALNHHRPTHYHGP